MRDLPRWYHKYLEIALNMHLKCPRGYALYACNRQQNGWPTDPPYCSPRSVEDFFKRVRLSTAQKWLKHWRAGGHIRVMGRSVEEQNRVRRVADQERRDCYRRWGVK